MVRLTAGLTVELELDVDALVTFRLMTGFSSLTATTSLLSTFFSPFLPSFPEMSLLTALVRSPSAARDRAPVELDVAVVVVDATADFVRVTTGLGILLARPDMSEAVRLAVEEMVEEVIPGFVMVVVVVADRVERSAGGAFSSILRARARVCIDISDAIHGKVE